MLRDAIEYDREERGADGEDKDQRYWFIRRPNILFTVFRTVNASFVLIKARVDFDERSKTCLLFL